MFILIVLGAVAKVLQVARRIVGFTLPIQRRFTLAVFPPLVSTQSRPVENRMRVGIYM